MAEQEVIKHTKKVYKIWNSKEHNVWHKAKEFIIEILIIVFAVSLSIYLHGKSEHNHDQIEVNLFLEGLRTDLQSDIKEMENDLESYQRQKRAFYYLSNLKKDEKINEDSLDYYRNGIYNKTWLIPNNGRYEGFKTSGNMNKIENEELRNQILDLYQEDLPSLLIATSEYVDKKEELFKFIRYNRQRLTDSTTNLKNVFKLDVVYNYSRDLSDINQINERYTNCIQKMTKIIQSIGKELN
jgi:hypothetical protein